MRFLMRLPRAAWTVAGRLLLAVLRRGKWVARRARMVFMSATQSALFSLHRIRHSVSGSDGVAF